MEALSMSRAALAFKPRTGRAVLIMLAGDFREPQIIERSEIPLLPAGEFAPYHAAKELEPEGADEYVKGSIARAQRLATSAVRDSAKRCAEAGHQLSGCAVLVGTGMPAWTTDQILAVHARMHKAEGEMFREVLVEAVRACGLQLTTLPDRTAIDSAAKKLGITRAKLDTCLAALGRAAGPPWTTYQKEAAAAALVVLKHSEASG
jgi:hypothetical protein